jgi:hypothetical protein
LRPFLARWLRPFAIALALLALPPLAAAQSDQKGDTGVMTFIVDRDGVVDQKDLGPRTDALARALTVYNPDATWQKATAQ